MKVFRKLRRRSSSQSPHYAFTNPLVPSETSSISSWGEESTLSGDLTAMHLTSKISDKSSETATDTSSLPPHADDFQEDSPTNWSTSSGKSFNLPLIVYERRRPPAPLPVSIRKWLIDADALVRSQEMQCLIGSSCDLFMSVAASSGNVILTAGGIVVDTALLPVRIPLHIASTATGLAACVAGRAVQKAIGGGQSTGENGCENEHPNDDLISRVLHVIPFMMCTAGRLTNEVGSAAANFVSPLIGIENGERNDDPNRRLSPIKETSSGESSSEREDVLERLRLDFKPTPTKRRAPPDSAYSKATPSDTSKFLLRVDDITVMISPDPAFAHARPRKAIFVDIGSEFADDSTTGDVLSSLMQRGLDISATNKDAHVGIEGHQTNSILKVEWKAERDTSRVHKKITQADQSECFRKLSHHVLVWSGKYNGPRFHGSENPLFLARGVVRRSPRELFDMLWDSDRTGEYNNFSLGRSDILVINNSISSKGDTGAKVIKSETRVPFAGITIALTALMHGKKLHEGGKQESYVIVSRSLSSGMAGCHVGSSKRVENNEKNEILLGVNMMRPVPGHPKLCDLMSVSQVRSSMVPQFLAYRIGMMGLEDFFNNVRKQ